MVHMVMEHMGLHIRVEQSAEALKIEWICLMNQISIIITQYYIKLVIHVQQTDEY